MSSRENRSDHHRPYHGDGRHARRDHRDGRHSEGPRRPPPPHHGSWDRSESSSQRANNASGVPPERSSSSTHPPARRWGPSQQHHSFPKQAPAAEPQQKQRADQVSDQEALEALLSSAKAREAEQKEKRGERRDGNRRWGNNNSDGDKKPKDEGTRKRDRNDEFGRKDDGRGEERDKNNYYGPSNAHSSKQSAIVGDETVSKPGGEKSEESAVEKEKPNFGLSGSLAKKDAVTAEKASNVYKGVVLKFTEPPEARAPNTLWRLYVFKGKEQVETLHISKQSAYLLGRNADIADIPLLHPSCSTQHAVIQYRALPVPGTNPPRLHCQPYLMDLESTNGSFINGTRLESARYYQLKKGDVLTFGASTREYVLMAATTKSI